jgi:hypothetical protein
VRLKILTLLHIHTTKRLPRCCTRIFNLERSFVVIETIWIQYPILVRRNVKVALFRLIEIKLDDLRSHYICCVDYF